MPLSLQYSIVSLLAISLFGGCASFEYAPDEIEINETEIYCKTIGFKGYRLDYPDDFELLNMSAYSGPTRDVQMVEQFRANIVESEGIDYHFHQDLVFRHEGRYIFFVPFQFKRAIRFRQTPEDILEDWLVDWARNGRFSLLVTEKYQLSVTTTDREHAVVSIKQKDASVESKVYEERIMTGDLNEIFIIAGYAPSREQAELGRDLDRLLESLTVIR